MEGIGLIVLGIVLGALASALWWRRYRRQRLPVVSTGVHCPLHDYPADVIVRTDPDARSGRRHVDIVACSLLSDAAVGLPEQRAYLPDAPPCEVVLDTAKAHPVYVTEVSCRKSCVHVLNAAASAAPPRPLTCASGVSDGIELMRQVDRHAACSRPLWYSGV